MKTTVSIRYSKMFDDLQKAALPKKEQKRYPSTERTYEYTKDIREYWKKHEKEILSEISKLTGLKWKESPMRCYVKGRGRNFSNPTNIGARENKDEFVDILTHELIHEIELQNNSIRTRWREHLSHKYPKEDPETISHILLFAVHYKTYMKLFDKRRLELNLKRNEGMPVYKKAWEIMLKENPDKIIEEFKRIK